MCIRDRCRTVCTPLGYRTPFPANSGGIVYTNSDLYVIGAFSHGLSNTFYGPSMISTLDVTNPMKTTALKEDWPSYRELLWGPTFQSGDSTIKSIPASFGQIVHLPQYYCQNTDVLTSAPQLPLLTDHLNIFMFDQMRGNTIEWEYRPQVSVLRNGRPYVPYRNSDEADIVYGNKNYVNTMLHLSQCDLDKNTSTCAEELQPASFTGKVPYDSYIEQVGSCLLYTSRCV